LIHWQNGYADLLRGFAYGLMALALARLFLERGTGFLGRRRWWLVAMVAGLASLQFAMFVAAYAGLDGIAQYASPLAATCLLAMSLASWPFLVDLRFRLRHRMQERVLHRLDQAEANARELRRWLLMAEEMAHFGHWRISVPGNEIFWSDELYRIHGLSPERFTPTLNSTIERFHPDDRDIVRASVEAALTEMTSYEWAARLVRPDGEIRHIFSRGSTELDQFGAVSGIFGVFLDLTEVIEGKNAEAALRSANQAAAVENRKLLELALVDSLTGLPNRRHFDAALERECKRAARDGTPLGLVMVDIDYFKAYNDIYGHPAGDDCLRRVAAAIATVPQRPGDLVARYGGEELVLLLPGSNAQGTKMLAELLVAAVAALAVPHKGAQGVVTISCGTATLLPALDRPDPAVLVQCADRALYKAKQSGRNRACCDKPERISGELALKS
jgi:diguanylate cyclase (GGDEF)-like protein